MSRADVPSTDAYRHPELASLAKVGLNLQSVMSLAQLPADLIESLQNTDVDLQPYRQVILLGHGGKRFWQVLQRSDFWQKQQCDPVDSFTLQQVEQYFNETLNVRYSCLYPAKFPVNLQAFGRYAGWHQASPLRVGVNPTWGSWYAYRALVLADSQLPLSDVIPLNVPTVCKSCQPRSCVQRCPVDALASGELDMSRCMTYRLQPDSPCANRCLAREACPVATNQRYTDTQIEYHYGVSLKMLRQYQSQADQL